MNDYIISAILGIIEGLTEFLPVSSTAHLRLAEPLMHINLHDEYWKMYSVFIQLGAILAVVVFFWGRLKLFASTFPRGGSAGGKWYRHPLSMVMMAFVVTAGPCYILDKKIGENLESLYVISCSLIIGGIVMWIVDALCTRPTVQRMENMSLVDALWIGAAQILSATFPGTSRSMSTIAAGQVFGLSRSAALDFSFFLAIPTMFAATLYKLLSYMRGKHVIDGGMTAHRWVVLAIGFVVSFLVAWVVVKWFTEWVKKRGFFVFAVYRVILGGITLIVAIMGK